MGERSDPPEPWSAPTGAAFPSKPPSPWPGYLSSYRFLTIPTDPEGLSYENLNRYYSLQFMPELTGPQAGWEAAPGLESIGADGAIRDYAVPLTVQQGFYQISIWLAP